MTAISAPIEFNANAGINVYPDGSLSFSTGTDSVNGKEFGFTPTGTITVDEMPLLTVANDGSVILQTGNASTGPLEAFVFGADGKINGKELGGSSAPAVQDTGWIDATLIGTWQWYGNAPVQTQAKAGYRKIGNRVQLRGTIKNPGLSGYNNSNIFKLPSGFYPGRQVSLLVNNVDKFCSAKIQTDGWVYLVGVDATWVTLDNISFLVD